MSKFKFVLEKLPVKMTKCISETSGMAVVKRKNKVFNLKNRIYYAAG